MSDQPAPSSPETQESAIARYARRAAQEKAARAALPVLPSLTIEEKARLMKRWGLATAIAVSLAFATVSQIVNLLLLPGVPVLSSPFGTVFGVLAVVVPATIIGFIAVTSLQAQTRLMRILVALLGVLLVWYIIRVGNLVAGMFLGTFVVMVSVGVIIPLVLLLIPYGLLIRWATSSQVRFFYRPWWHWQRLLVPVCVLVLAVLAGSRFIYTPGEQQALRVMHETMQQAQSARNEQQLPSVIARMPGAPFLTYARGSYELTLTGHRVFTYEVNPDGTPRNVANNSVIYAEFANSYVLSCQFTSKGVLMYCWSDWVPPRGDVNG